MAFKYRGGKRTVEGVVRRSKQSSGSFDRYISSDVTVYKAKEGENTVRILPPPDMGSEEKNAKYMEKWGDGWEVMIWLHRNIGADESTYLCRKKMLGKRCPICDAIEDASDEEEAKALRPRQSPACWVIDRDNEKSGPQFWTMSWKLFKGINLRSVDKKTGAVVLIDHPKEGYDISFTREGTDIHTTYVGEEVDREASPIHTKESRMERWLTYVNENPIPNILQFYDPDHLEKVLAGQFAKDDDDDDDEDEDEGKKGKKGKGKKGKGKGKSKKDDDDDEDEDADDEADDEDEDEDEDDEDDKKSKKSKKKKSKKDDDDDDEDEDDEDEEDEDEDDEDEDDKKSKSKKKKSKSKKDDDDEDDEDEDEDEDDDEDEPKKSKSKKSKSKKDDDDEDDDDEDDDEDDKKSKKKSKKSAKEQAKGKLQRLKRKAK